MEPYLAWIIIAAVIVIVLALFFSFVPVALWI